MSSQTVKFAKQHCKQWGSGKYYHFAWNTNIGRRTVIRAGVVVKV